MKSLTIKSKTIIAICLFVVLFATLVAVASVFDYQVSQILTKNALKPGEYLADDIFGVVGEAIGTSPIYILLGVCTAILCWFFAKNFKDKKWGIVLAVIFGLVGTVAWWYYIKDIMKYILEHAATKSVLSVLSFTSIVTTVPWWLVKCSSRSPFKLLRCFPFVL